MPSPFTLVGAVLVAVLALLLGACGQARDAVSVAAALPLDLSPALAGAMSCGTLPVAVIRKELADFTGDGVLDAVIAARCDAGAGNPPSAVFALAATPDGTGVPERLLDPARGDVLKDIRTAGQEVTVVTFSYSPGVPRCCPDLEVTSTFHWDGGRVVPGPVTRAPLVAAAG